MQTLSPAAQDIVNRYLKLPLGNGTINAPYFNNQRAKVRAGLAALVGKGLPEEIALEAEVLARAQKFPITTAADLDIKKFLVTNNLGVDCSALTYYVLRYEGIIKHKKDLQSALKFPEVKNWFRKFIVKLRPSQNINVAVLGAPENSFAINKNEIQPGDLIFMWNTGLEHKLNHVLIITEVNEKHLTYAHSFRWRNEGQYDHGVRLGSISWTDPTTPLLEDVWIEKNQTGISNDTWQHAREAERFEIRRLNILK